MYLNFNGIKYGKHLEVISLCEARKVRLFDCFPCITCLVMFLVQIQFYNQNTFEKDVNQGENSEKNLAAKKYHTR